MRIRILSMVCVLLFTVGCAKHVPIHPGSISNLDSYAYDLLLVEQDVLNQAKTDYAAGSLAGTSAKSILNAAITQYNVTQEQWHLYHAGGQNATALNQALDALVLAIGQLQEYRGKKVAGTGPISFYTGPPEDCTTYTINGKWRIEHPCRNLVPVEVI